MATKKAKEILLANGYTEAEIADPALATLLSNPKFCLALEKENADAESARTEQARLQSELDGDLNWYQTQAAPALKKTTQDAIDANARAAAAEARLKAMQDYGLAKVGEQVDKDKGGNVNPNPNPNPNTTHPDLDPRYVTSDTFQQGFERVGDIMQMVVDIPLDHRDLFGTPIPGGVAGLRKEYRAAVEQHRYRGSLADFWEQKYKVPEKRAELESVRRQKELDEYAATKVKARETELISQYGNPQTRPMQTSRSPFTNRSSVVSGQASVNANANANSPAAQNTGERKQPWEKSQEERSANRVTNFVKRQMEKQSA